MALLTRLFVLLCLGLAFSPAGAEGFSHHYEYVFFVRGKPTQDVVALAKAALPATLARHRLVEPGNLRQWDGKGPQALLALEQRSKRLADVTQQEIFDTGEPLADVLGLRHADTVTQLAVMIGVPPKLDVAAYVEALSLSISIGKALRSPAFVDNETGELHLVANLRERQQEGMRSEERVISASNPPAVSIMEGITQLDHLPGSGLRTRGLRKLGLPDIALERAVPGYSHLDTLQMVGNLLINGKASPTPGTTMTLRTGDPALGGNRVGRAGGAGRVHLAASTLAPGPVLRIEFDGEPQAHEFERQMLFYSGMWGSRYPSLSAGQEKALLRALAKAKALTLELWPRLEALRLEGTRVFFAYRMDLLLSSPRSSGAPEVEREWHQFIGEVEEGQPLVRRWTGDPRKGGAVERMSKPLVIDGRTYEFIDSDLNLDIVDDVLVIDPRGTATGGEVLSLVRQLAAETPSRLRR